MPEEMPAADSKFLGGVRSFPKKYEESELPPPPPLWMRPFLFLPCTSVGITGGLLIGGVLAVLDGPAMLGLACLGGAALGLYLDLEFLKAKIFSKSDD